MGSNTSSSLSSTQLDTITSILENYDSDNLTQSDAKAIVKAFQEAGIEASSDLESAMEEAGFSAQEVGTLAGVGPQSGGMPPAGGGGGTGGGGGGGETASSEEEYDTMDLNQDGIVSADEIAEYYGSDDTTQELSSSNQDALDNLKLLMETLKANSEDGSIDTKNFDGLLKTINNQNNNSSINTYLSNNTATTSMYGYA